MRQSTAADLIAEITRAGRLSPPALGNLAAWLEDPTLAEFRPQILELVRSEEWLELEDAFYMHVMVGTGGIRGKLGPGPNRINTRTIGEAAQGLVRFIEASGDAARAAGVVVGHEARRGSRRFAEMCCEVFAANRIRSFLFDGLRATPEVSFAVRHLGATAGVQITASHNPRTDNGFKFYGSDGGQVVPPHDARFMQLVAEVRDIRRLPLEEARSRGLVTTLGHAVDEAYLRCVRGLSLEPRARSASVVLSPMHGAGSTNVLPVLLAEGFTVTTVPEQLQPDETFPTAVGDLINPEYREVMELPMRLADAVGADLAICSDPDADRAGIAARARIDEPGVQLLSGNQVGTVLTHYLLEQRKASGRLSPDDLVVETYVTTSLIADIAARFGIRCRSDLLVGFKWMAQVVAELPNPDNFVLATEESIGYMAGDFVRDKDAAIGALLVAELASWLKDQGRSVVDYLDDIYRAYGYYVNLQFLVELPGKAGRTTTEQVMRSLGLRPPPDLAGCPVLRTLDRLPPGSRARPDYKLGSAADMLTFVLSDDERSRVTVRPSGTEPKLKYYIQLYEPVASDLDRVRRSLDARAHRIAAALGKVSAAGLEGHLLETWQTATTRLV